VSFSSIYFYQFRNLQNATVPVPSEQVFFIGENGQGKSNFLEAIYFLCYGSSFRTRKDEHLVLHDTQEMAVSGTWNDDRGSSTLSIKIEKGKKTITLNGEVMKDRSQLVDMIPCVVFSHEDIEFVKGPPEVQRWFFNQTSSMVDPTFLDHLRRYTRILKTRNQILKDGRVDLLPVYDHQLVVHGLPLQAAREGLVDSFNKVFADIFSYVSDLPLPLEIRYIPSWGDNPQELDVLSLLEKKRDYDSFLKTSTRGPHRDKFTFFYGDQDFSTLGSTGQFRLVSLVLRAAQARLLADYRRKKPVLLIDDVLLELDDGRRKKFLQCLPEFSQAFYTFLPDEHVREYISGKRITYRVKNGAFYEESL